MNNIKTFDEFNDLLIESILLEKNIPLDKKLWSQCKSEAKRKYDVWPSAYACGFASKRYKAKGGKWKKEKSVSEEKKYKGGLDKWFDEKWVDISKTNADGTHPPCGREDASKGAYPKCRKVKVAAKMSDKDKKNSVRRKRAVEKKGNDKKTPNYST